MGVGMQLEYKAKKLGHIRQEDVDAVAQELSAIAEKNGSGFDAALVVEAARDPASAMHRYFEWDDSLAAQQWRLYQARSLIRSIQVKVVVKDGPQPETAFTRKYHHVRVSQADEEPESRYVPLEAVTSRESYLNQVIANAERELLGWRERVRTYQSFKEFARFNGVISAIDQMCEDTPSVAAK